MYENNQNNEENNVVEYPCATTLDRIKLYKIALEDWSRPTEGENCYDSNLSFGFCNYFDKRFNIYVWFSRQRQKNAPELFEVLDNEKSSKDSNMKYYFKLGEREPRAQALEKAIYLCKKKIALELLVPYLADPSTCASDGRMCVAGKCMVNPSNTPLDSIKNILQNFSQTELFKPEYVDVFTTYEWRNMQMIHDLISYALIYKTEEYKGKRIRARCISLGLFTYEEFLTATEEFKNSNKTI